MAQTVHTYGASVRGPRNQREGRANQDAWTRASGAFGHLVAVCDGVGSRRDADIGARAACRALRQAAGHWHGGVPAVHLVRLVETLWRLGIGQISPADCACTCLFALREPDGRLLLAGLGDGLAMIRQESNALTVYGGRGAEAFGNDTLALGTPHRIDDWWVASEQPQAGRTVVLATDGVADDLEPARRGALVDWLSDEIRQLPPAARWRRLCRELREWPVPHHVDDKTIAVMVEHG